MPILIGRPKHEEELMEKLLHYSHDQNWIKENYSRLFEQYPMKYIAVKNKKVCYVSDSMKDLVSKIILKGDIPGNYAIEYLTDEIFHYLF